ncbi:MAG: hypothetical protein ACXW27_16955 [Allosphingosinicella sp.]
MAKPPPQSGLVIRYDYLWIAEEREGREEGAKVRPCAIVVAVEGQGSGPQRVVVCGITHAPPSHEAAGIFIPRRVKAHLGLDDAPSWIVTSEVNLVDWDDPGIIPVAPGRWTYGFLPPALARAVRDRIMAQIESGAVPLVDRPKIERRRAKRGVEQALRRGRGAQNRFRPNQSFAMVIAGL